MKEAIGAIAVVLTFVGYAPYIRDTLRGKTHPHVYTWFLWGFVTAIAWSLQITDNAGPGSFVTLAAAIVCFAIFALGMRVGKKDITRSDTIFLVMALIALGIWLVAKQPVVSVILLSLTDMLAFVPTIRKSWNKPHTETLFSYEMNTFRFALAIVALHHYTIITSLYPISWLVANGLFSIFLVVRRKTLAHA